MYDPIHVYTLHDTKERIMRHVPRNSPENLSFQYSFQLNS